MKQERNIMGMPVRVEVRDEVSPQDFEAVFEYFTKVDEKFSTYKPESEISKFNRGEILEKDLCAEMKEVLKLSDDFKKVTNGYFDIKNPKREIDPSGLVKGWAIKNAANILQKRGFKNFYVEAGGDVQTLSHGEVWTLGIKNPFNQTEIVKVLKLKNQGVATSGTYIRGQHIYNPHSPESSIRDIVSITVVGDNVYEADCFATAAFAMGKEGINFIENLEGFEGYLIDKEGAATMTSGFEKYV